MEDLLHHDVSQDHHLTEEQKTEKRYLIKAERALRNEQRRRSDIRYNNAIYDEHEQRQNPRTEKSAFQIKNRLLEFCGDFPISRFWFYSSAGDVDKTISLTFWCYEEDHDIDDEWYRKGPDDFNKVVKLLTPRATEREYGRVFFSTETRYIDQEDVCPTSLKQSIRGYYKEPSLKRAFIRLSQEPGGHYRAIEQKLFCTFKRKPRSDLYHPPLTGKTTYGRRKRFTYQHTGTGILKRLTFEVQRYHYFKQRIRTIELEFLLSPPPSAGPLGGSIAEAGHQDSVAAVLFAELRNNHLDFDYWLNKRRKVIASLEEDRESEEYWRTARSRGNARQDYRRLRTLIFDKVRHSNAVRRVQALWRASKFCSAVRDPLVRRIQRARRAYVLRSLGTKRTIIGMLSNKNKRIKY